MKCSSFLLFLLLTICLFNGRSFAQNTEYGREDIMKADSIITYASNEQVIGFLISISDKDVNSSANPSLLKSLYTNINIVLREDSLWVSALNKNKVNFKSKFFHPVIDARIGLLYQKFLDTYSEGKQKEAAIYYYRADYLRISFFTSERKRMLDNYQRAHELINEHSYIKARQLVDEFYNKDINKLDYLLLKDTLVTRYQQLNDRLFPVENTFQWGAMQQKPCKWRFSFGADFFLNPDKTRLGWYFKNPALEQVPPGYMRALSLIEPIKTEGLVQYSFDLTYNFHPNFAVGMDASYSTLSISFLTDYFSTWYLSIFDLAAKTRMHKAAVDLSGQYNFEFSPGLLTYLKLGSGICWRGFDEIVPERSINSPYEPIKVDPATTPRILAELGLGKLLGKEGTYGITGSLTVAHNLKQVDYITRTEFTAGIKWMFIIR